MRGIKQRAFWLFAVSFLLSGKLCLFAEEKFSSHKQSSPTQFTAKIVAVDYERRTCLVEIEKRFYLFSLKATTILKRGKKLPLRELTSGQTVTLLLVQKESEFDVLSIVIGPSSGPAEPAGSDVSSERAAAVSVAGGGSPGRREQGPSSGTGPTTPSAEIPPAPHLVGSHPLNRRTEASPFN